MAPEWLSTSDLASLAGISYRKARQALARGTWRGAKLVVRQVPGQGGRSGLHYEVLVSSLPPAHQERLRHDRETSPPVLRSDAGANLMRAWLANLIAPALAHPKRSRERAAAVRSIAGTVHLKPDGCQARFSERQIYRALKAFDQSGVVGLQKRARRDRGERRVLISRLWDTTVPFDAAARERIAARATDHVRALWRSGAALSMVVRMGSEGLMKATREAGFDPGPRELLRICELPRRFVEPHKHLRKVHRYERDRKAHEDARPRVRRTCEGLDPMELVNADVHPVDLPLKREDGSVAYTRMIGWFDLATKRIFATFVLCPAGESVRNEHVIASFIAMTQHPEWGMPRRLYLDNGSEYNFADFITDALKLVGQGLERVDPIIRAKPYNAAAKPIEGGFRNLEQSYFRLIPEWVGGDRMRAKTANVGRAPAPFHGSMGDFEKTAQSLITLYETQHKRGDLKGRSPRQAFTAACDAGWQRTDVDPFALRIAFSTEETRVVRQGSIEVRGVRWTCPELQTYLGERVTVLIPKYEDWSSLPLKDEQGRWLGNAVRDLAYHPLDQEGARDAERRSRLYEKAVRAAGRAVPRRDLVGEAIASAALAPPAPVPPSAGVITLNHDAAAIGRAIAEKPAQRRSREQAAIEAEQTDALARSERSLQAARRAAQRKAG